jgi:nitronate monooxygenase
MSAAVPAFPLAAAALAPLRAKSEAAGRSDFTNLWSGQSAALARRSLPAGQLTRMLAQQTLDRLWHRPPTAPGIDST